MGVNALQLAFFSLFSDGDFHRTVHFALKSLDIQRELGNISEEEREVALSRLNGMRMLK